MEVNFQSDGNQNHDSFIYAIIVARQTIFLISLLSSLFVILSILLSRKCGKNSFMLLLAQSVAELCVYASGITITHDTQQYFDSTGCQVQAYFIHVGWLSEFIMCMLMNYTILKTLKNEMHSQNIQVPRMILKGFIVACLLQLFPLINENLGPTGWFYNQAGQKDQELYIYCGYKLEKWNVSSARLKQLIVYLFFYALPTIVIIAINLYFTHQIKQQFSRIKPLLIDMNLLESGQDIVKLKIFPIVSSLFWGYLISLRLYDILFQQAPERPALKYIYQLANIFFDIQGFINAIIFFLVFRHILDFKKIWTGDSLFESQQNQSSYMSHNQKITQDLTDSVYNPYCIRNIPMT